MSFTTRVGLLAGATALTLTGVSTGAPANQDNDLAQRLAAAEAEIAAMKAAQNQNWMTEQRAAEIRGIVHDVLADADTRASLLQAGATAGYDNGFILSSTDGNWLLRLNMLMQQRFIYNNQDDTAAEDGDTNRWGFENTRSKLMFSGNVVNPSWFYRLDINFGSPAGDEREGTLNAYLGHDYGNGWKVQIGSMKAPLLREELVEAQYQQAVERSNLNYFFTGGYADGLLASYEGDQFRFAGMVSDGARSGQMPWNDFDTEYAITGRGEFLASGTWTQFNDFTSAPGGETGILVGAAAHWEKGEFGLANTEHEIISLTGDVSAEFGGFNLFGALVWNDIDDLAGFGDNPWGFVLQGGFYLTDEWELFGRFEWIDLDFPDVDEVMIGTLGVNRYFAGHNAKWTTDVGYAFDTLGTVGAFSPVHITGFRTDNSDDDGQFVVRSQIQILY